MGPGIISLLLALSLCPPLPSAEPDKPGDIPPGPPGPPEPPGPPGPPEPPGLPEPTWEHGGWGHGRPWKKPGECPEDVDFSRCGGWNNNPDFKRECKRDRDCDGQKKCCFSRCRNRCLLPLQDKGDFCPYFDDRRCRDVRTKPGECHKDSQCQGTDKCCYNDCRQQCTPSVKEKPGSCPPPPFFCHHHDGWGGRGSCKTDRDCPNVEKCCAPRCRRRCINPYAYKPDNEVPVDINVNPNPNAPGRR